MAKKGAVAAESALVRPSGVKGMRESGDKMISGPGKQNKNHNVAKIKKKQAPVKVGKIDSGKGGSAKSAPPKVLENEDSSSSEDEDSSVSSDDSDAEVPSKVNPPNGSTQSEDDTSSSDSDGDSDNKISVKADVSARLPSNKSGSKAGKDLSVKGAGGAKDQIAKSKNLPKKKADPVEEEDDSDEEEDDSDEEEDDDSDSEEEDDDDSDSEEEDDEEEQVDKNVIAKKKSAAPGKASVQNGKQASDSPKLKASKPSAPKLSEKVMLSESDDEDEKSSDDEDDEESSDSDGEESLDEEKESSEGEEMDTELEADHKANTAAKSSKKRAVESQESSTDASKRQAKKAKKAPEHANATEAKQSSTPSQKHSVIVTNLSWGSNEGAVRSLFESCGEVTKVNIVRDHRTGKSKGYCYVEFDTPEALQTALSMSGTTLDSRELRVAIPTPQHNAGDTQQRPHSSQQPSSTLFVGNISWSITEDYIRDTFSEYGSVVAVRLPTDRNSGKPKGFGYVEFSTVDDAKSALESLNGTEHNGRSIRVDFSVPRSNAPFNKNAGGPQQRSNKNFGRNLGGESFKNKQRQFGGQQHSSGRKTVFEDDD